MCFRADQSGLWSRLNDKTQNDSKNSSERSPMDGSKDGQTRSAPLQKFLS